jgi:hypothetical protein
MVGTLRFAHPTKLKHYSDVTAYWMPRFRVA